VHECRSTWLAVQTPAWDPSWFVYSIGHSKHGGSSMKLGGWVELCVSLFLFVGITATVAQNRQPEEPLGAEAGPAKQVDSTQ